MRRSCQTALLRLNLNDQCRKVYWALRHPFDRSSDFIEVDRLRRTRKGKVMWVVFRMVLMVLSRFQREQRNEMRWSISPQGCDFGRDIPGEVLREYSDHRRREEETRKRDPFEVPDEFEGDYLKRMAEKVDEDIAQEAARLDELWSPDWWNRNWPHIAARLWFMSAESFWDRVRFLPTERGRNRKIEFMISREPYLLHVDIGSERIECRICAEPVETQSQGQSEGPAL